MKRILLCLLLIPTLVLAKNITVNGPAGPDNYTTIHLAITAAAANDTIIIFGAGPYNETNMTLNKAGLTIKNNPGDTPAINGAGFYRVFTVNTRDVTIDGLHIYNWDANNAETDAIYSISSATINLTVKNCKFHMGDSNTGTVGHCAEQAGGVHPCLSDNPIDIGGGDGGCIYFNGGHKLTVTNCEFWNTATAIQLVGARPENTDTYGNGAGAGYANGVNISGNNCHECPRIFVDMGSSCAWVMVENNKISDMPSLNQSGSQFNSQILPANGGGCKARTQGAATVPGGACYHSDGLHAFGPATNPTGPGYNHMTLRNNVLRNPGTLGCFYELRGFDSNDVWIYNNLVYNTIDSINIHGFVDAPGCTPYNGTWPPTPTTCTGISKAIQTIGINGDARDGWHIYNNTVINMPASGIAASTLAGGGGPGDIRNNITMNCNQGISSIAPASNTDYNVYSGNTIDLRDSSGSHTIENEPNGIHVANSGTGGLNLANYPPSTLGFLSAALTSSSAAVDAAVTINGLTGKDILGVNRGTVWDAGAYELAAGGNPTVSGNASATFVIGSATNTQQTFTASNFNGTPTWSRTVNTVPAGATAGALPNGVTFTGGVSNTATIQGTATGAVAGAYTMTLTATYSPSSQSANKSFTLTAQAGNSAPTVSISTPTAGQIFTEPAQVSLTSSPTDSDGTVASVSYYRGGTTLIGSSTVAPDYTFNWGNVTAGTYSLTAKATDNLNLQGAASSAVSITVSGPVATPTPATIRVRP